VGNNVLNNISARKGKCEWREPSQDDKIFTRGHQLPLCKVVIIFGNQKQFNILFSVSLGVEEENRKPVGNNFEQYWRTREGKCDCREPSQDEKIFTR
jgi:hypothetical protein